MEITTDESDNAVAEFGPFGICNSPRNGMLWIEHESGEGMEVPEAVFIDALRKFYSDNF